MDKADEKSKQYRDYREQCGIKDPVMLNEIEAAYYVGYHQAEKDLELTWEDIKVIEKLLGFDNIIESPKEFYQEVLKRFNKGMRNK